MLALSENVHSYMKQLRVRQASQNVASGKSSESEMGSPLLAQLIS